MTAVVPEFAIIGHPNEGKSSVLSTLAEDDTVRVSPIPGETVACQTFPVVIDGCEIIRFIDTPGFQNPRRTLQWLQAYQGPPERMLAAFLAAHRDDRAFRDDCELLGPVVAGAGVIFVVDGSRPLRHADRAEMEILRLSGAPRMAVINCKEEDTAYLAEWQSEFRKHFNAIRIFNSRTATYRQRIELLDSLKAIDQQLEPALRTVITAFKADWETRNRRTVEILVELLEEVLPYTRTVPCEEREAPRLREELQAAYQQLVAARERQAHEAIRRLFKHNIFHLDLPPQSILAEDLFSRNTWEFLGLSKTQLILAGAVGGAALGVGIDAATFGSSFGLVSAVGGLLGAGLTALKGRELLSGIRLLGMKMGGEQLQVGPVSNIQFLFILLDRSLLFYAHVINWAHGRRDYEQTRGALPQTAGKGGFTASWSRERRRVCEDYFRTVRSGARTGGSTAIEALRRLLAEQLAEISEGRGLAAGEVRWFGSTVRPQPSDQHLGD